MDFRSFDARMQGSRSALLQKCLRENLPVQYKIDLEFPIVLNPIRPEFSICATLDPPLSSNQVDCLVAHANLWPRLIVSDSDHMEKPIPIALVGNVATSPDYRGRGHMRRLFDHLWDLAIQAHLDGLVLWSDLGEFYHKLGFVPCGQEWRFEFSADKLARFNHSDCEIILLSSQVSDQCLGDLMKLRPAVGRTLMRSVSEFRVLLTIPDTSLIVCKNEGRIEGYCIVGKGADMQGVAHEFGALEPEYLFAMLSSICTWMSSPVITLLAPSTLSFQWQQKIDPFLSKKNRHSMALVRERPGSGLKEALNSCFIWGLDSI